MTLKEVKEEKYFAKVESVTKTFNNILEDLSKYLTHDNNPVKKITRKPNFINDDFSGIYRNKNNKVFKIPSINGSLRIDGQNKPSGRMSRGGSIEHLSEGTMDVNFIYLDGTSDSDLKIVRDSLINNGLEERTTT